MQTNQIASQYYERLWPSLTVYLLMLVMTASFGIAFGHAYGHDLGMGVFVGSTFVAIIAMLIFTPRIEVTSLGLRAGIAVLPCECIGEAHVLDATATASARSSRAHASAYFLLRGWVKTSVIVQVVDLRDPHPYWHISTRHPDQLQQAIKFIAQAGGNHEHAV